MDGRAKVFVSHTTRDKRDHALAHKLASGLRLRGAKVWIAPDSIPPGERWAEEIVAGVMEQSTHFVVILSAGSVQADWVLREIDLARRRLERDAGYSVLPLVVGSLGAFAGKAFLDTLQRLPYHDEFPAQLEAVAEAIGLRPSAVVALPPTAASPAEFVGREYVLEAVEAFMAGHRNGYFLLEGDPGAGKSAILAELVRRSGCLAHFNVRALGVNTARQFLESVCGQLIARYGLDHPSLPPEATRDGGFLSRLLEEASGRLGPAEQLVIAVDALDEVDLTGHPEGPNVLYLPARLPDRVYFVASRRQVALPFTVHAPQELYDLLEHREETDRDVRTYVERAAARAGVRSWVDRRGLDPAAFVSELVGHSEGNFIYLRYILPEIEAGRYDDLDVEALPRGLEGYYEDHWRRMGMTARPLPRSKIRIVYVLSELRRPLSRRLIAELAADERLGLDELTVQEVLDEWDQFLHEQVVEGTRRYSVYHTSFRDFLHRKDIVQAAGVTIEAINELISDSLWGELFGDEAPDRTRAT
jgi:TIR domain